MHFLFHLLQMGFGLYAFWLLLTGLVSLVFSGPPGRANALQSMTVSMGCYGLGHVFGGDLLGALIHCGTLELFAVLHARAIRA